MSDDTISKIFDKLDSLGSEVSKMQVKMAETLSELKVAMATITAFNQEKEKRCDMHSEQMVDHETRITTHETRITTLETVGNNNKSWILAIIAFITAFGAIIAEIIRH